MSDEDEEYVISEHLLAQSNDATFASVLDELRWRGLIAVSTDLGQLQQALDAGPITYYCGFDPTASSLHLGNLVQLLTMRRLQLAGNRPLALVGGATGLIGDPRPTAERQLNDRDTVARWVDLLRVQIERFLPADGDNGLRMVNNLDWTSKLSAIDLLRDIGKHFRVGSMLAKDAVSARLNSDAGISYTEFSYQVLQGNDFLQLFREYDCVLETGGQDQWGNLTAGTDLVRKVTGKSAHAFGTPLITNSDGTKFGKSEGNAIWIDPDLVTPYQFYQFWLNTDDDDVVERLKVFTFLTREEIEALEQAVAEAPFKREAQRTLAWEVTALVHGAAAADGAVDASKALFGNGSLDVLDAPTLRAATSGLASTGGAIGDKVVQAAVATGLVKSVSEARRAIAQHGLYLNNEPVDSDDRSLAEFDFLQGEIALLRRGKKTIAAVHRG